MRKRHMTRVDNASLQAYEVFLYLCLAVYKCLQVLGRVVVNQDFRDIQHFGILVEANRSLAQKVVLRV